MTDKELLQSTSKCDINTALSEILSRSNFRPTKVLRNECVDVEVEPSSFKVDTDTFANPVPSAYYQPHLTVPTFELLSPHLSDQELRTKFFDDICVGARICTRALRVGIVVLEVELVCMLSHFRRFMLPYMRAEKCTVNYDKSRRNYCINDYIAVLMKMRNMFDESTYSSNETINVTRKNPNLCEAISVRIDTTRTALNSLAEKLSGNLETAVELRTNQTRKLAMIHVTRGAQLTREAKYFEAIQCFNRALVVDESCADAYVGRGAACAGDSNFTAALSDFQKALEHESHHKNAIRYFIEVSLAFGKQLERERKFPDAKEKYDNALKLVPTDSRCIDAVRRVTRRIDSIDVIDLEDDGDDSRKSGNGDVSKKRRISTNAEETAEASRRKLKEMEAFIDKLKRSK
ncbi:tetratricopeptide repeat protein 14 like protein [Ditylenchus destructor]|uniref:Tetratricopeptide repeat protein 14 like protein n=1 Tax=Ditylenchus destructor TaxID=166010 RepID=A0AAD4N3V4_9BILA|nr:tetratricopeptide repeat protein 14 like protein [Ditylenchus destructor]